MTFLGGAANCSTFLAIESTNEGESAQLTMMSKNNNGTKIHQILAEDLCSPEFRFKIVKGNFEILKNRTFSQTLKTSAIPLFHCQDQNIFFVCENIRFYFKIIRNDLSNGLGTMMLLDCNAKLRKMH